MPRDDTMPQDARDDRRPFGDIRHVEDRIATHTGDRGLEVMTNRSDRADLANAARPAVDALAWGSRPTICHLLHSLRMGGAEVLATRLARRLGSDFRFVFACLEEVGTLGEELRAEGFPVEVLGRRPGIDWRCSRRLSDYMGRERVDLLQTHQYTPFFYGGLARLLGRRPPILFTEHGRPFPDYPRPRRIVANRLMLRRRDRVVAVGEAVRQALIRNEGFPAARVEVIYNGADLSTFGAPGDRAAARKMMGVDDADLVILQVARLDPLKDHATAIRTVECVARARPDARLVLVGEGPEEGMIRGLARERGIEAHVRLLGLRTDVDRLLPGADLFLLTSVTEGIPVTLIEAMAAGLPIVGTRVGGMGEVVEEGLNGLLAPSGDGAGLAEAVLRLAGDPELRGRMGRHGKGRAEEMFTESRMHDGYRRLYEEILGRPRAGVVAEGVHGDPRGD
jgi:glycosyltransferase involved in cell wall biosynthesis